jgi:hypothetical protein
LGKCLRVYLMVALSSDDYRKLFLSWKAAKISPHCSGSATIE